MVQTAMISKSSDYNNFQYTSITASAGYSHCSIQIFGHAMVQRVNCHPLSMDIWVGRICGGHSTNEQVLFRVLQFSLVSAITSMLHQLSNWQHNYIKTTVQITMFNNPNTSKEDQVSTGSLQLNVQIQFF